MCIISRGHQNSALRSAVKKLAIEKRGHLFRAEIWCKIFLWSLHVSIITYLLWQWFEISIWKMKLIDWNDENANSLLFQNFPLPKLEDENGFLEKLWPKTLIMSWIFCSWVIRGYKAIHKELLKSNERKMALFRFMPVGLKSISVHKSVFEWLDTFLEHLLLFCAHRIEILTETTRETEGCRPMVRAMLNRDRMDYVTQAENSEYLMPV
jgi:hypothetical protein